LRNDGGFRFAAVPWPANLEHARLVASAADLDGDGDQDLVALRNLAHPVYVQILLNDGTGGFADATSGRFHGTGSSYQPFATALALGDVDGDGDVDLIVGHGSSSQNRLYRNDGAGYFTDGTQGGLPYINGSTADLELVDVDARTSTS
jgi:hypothetical protein